MSTLAFTSLIRSRPVCGSAHVKILTDLHVFEAPTFPPNTKSDFGMYVCLYVLLCVKGCMYVKEDWTDECTWASLAP
jgi:hypothetical protein